MNINLPAVRNRKVINVMFLQVNSPSCLNPVSFQPSFVACQLLKKGARANSVMVTEYFRQTTNGNDCAWGNIPHAFLSSDLVQGRLK